jgi:plasmid stability protein
MASITIRNLDDHLKTRLRAQAAGHGRSMAAEALAILQSVLAPAQPPPRNLAASIRAKFADLGGVELPLVAREPIRPAPSFDD